MSTKKIPWIISILFHLTIALILLFIKLQIKKEAQKPPLEITYVSPIEEYEKIEPEEKREEVLPQKIKPLPKIEDIVLPERRTTTYIPEYLAREHITPEDSIRLLQESIRKYFKEKEIIPYAGNKFEFLDFDFNEKYKTVLEQDSLKMLEILLAKNFENIVLSEEEIRNLPRHSDPTAEWLFRRQGGADVLPIIPLIAKGIQLAQKVLKNLFFEENPERANLFLSNIEIRILNIIWVKKIVTPSSLYERLPPNINLKLSNIVNILMELESKKILVSKKGLYEYIYVPVVSKKDVFEYYIRNLIELDEIENKNIPVSQNLKDSLLRKIELLNSDTVY